MSIEQKKYRRLRKEQDQKFKRKKYIEKTTKNFEKFEEELARLGRRLHYDLVMFDQEYKPQIIWGMTHEEIISNKN